MDCFFLKIFDWKKVDFHENGQKTSFSLNWSTCSIDRDLKIPSCYSYGTWLSKNVHLKSGRSLLFLRFKVFYTEFRKSHAIRWADHRGGRMFSQEERSAHLRSLVSILWSEITVCSKRDFSKYDVFLSTCYGQRCKQLSTRAITGLEWLDDVTVFELKLFHWYLL